MTTIQPLPSVQGLGGLQRPLYSPGLLLEADDLAVRIGARRRFHGRERAKGVPGQGPR